MKSRNLRPRKKFYNIGTCCAQTRILRLIRLEGREGGGRALDLERGRLVDPAMVFDEAAYVVRDLRRQRHVEDHDRLA